MTREHSEGDLRLAFIGAGDWVHQYHLPVIRSLPHGSRVTVAGIWNRTREKAEKLASAFGVPKVYRDLQEVVDDQDVNCLSVAVSRWAVGDVLRTLADRNLPVICEKPPGRDGQEARELANLITAPNVVAFNRRYMPLNQQFKELVDQQERIDFVDCSFYRRNRDVADFVNETGVHGVNLLEYLCGNIVRVETERWNIPRSSTFNWIARVQFASGARGRIKFFPRSGIAMENVEVTSTDLTASCSTAHPFTDTGVGEISVSRHGENGDLSISGTKQTDNSPLIAGGFAGEYLDLFRSIREGLATLSNFQNSWRSVLIADAIQNGLSLELPED